MGRKSRGARRVGRSESKGAKPSKTPVETAVAPDRPAATPYGSKPAPSTAAWATVILLASAAICGGLAVFQWMELLLAEAGVAPVCSIDDVFNCIAVWEAPLAKQWQALTGIPVAGWGLLWSMLALSAGLWCVWAQLRQVDTQAAVAAIQALAGAGVVTAIGLGGYSLSLGQVCLTCLITYALVAGYAGAAWGLSSAMPSSDRPATLPIMSGPAYRTAAVALGVASIAGVLALRIPGAKLAEDAPLPPPRAATPAATPSGMSVSSPDVPVSRSGNVVAEFLESLAPAARKTVLEGLKEHRVAPRPPLPPLTERPFVGAEDAAVRITDFSDLRCPHCARLAAEMARMAESLPADAFRLESRYFPLDAECNGRLDPRATDGSGVRCTSAKVLLCAQGEASYEALRRRMFREQASLTVDKVIALAIEMLDKSEDELRGCIAAPETERKLSEDIAYAARFDIRGTPMVIMNGRRVLAFPPLLMALILADGDPDHPGFGQLASR